MTNTIAPPSLLTPLVSSAAMRAVLDDRARLQRMLNFEVARSRGRLRRVRREALALQFGGVGGTLAELGERGLVISERLAALLDLPLPDAPWHGHSDRLAEVAAAIAILTGTCGKIARDFTLLM